MNIVTYTEARKNLKSVLDRVVEDADTTIITRRNAGDVVILAKADYDGLMETFHLLRSTANRDHLSRSIHQYHHGEVIKRDLLE